MKRISFLLLLTVGLSFVFSCEKDPVTEDTQLSAPPLPSMETFIMPFTGFERVDTPGVASPGEIEIRTPHTFRNWAYAGLSVVGWSTAVALGSAIPVAAFAESFNHDPVPLGDGVWSWSFDTEVGGQVFTTVLTGEFINGNGDTRWVMKASQQGGLQDVEWYNGVVSEDGNVASWTLYHQPDNPEPFVQIDYERNPANEQGQIRYTNIIPGSDENGHYIEFTTIPDGDFNRSYDVYRGADDFLEIRWNAPAKAGQVRNPAFFGDNDWHCWDEEYRDVDC